ncbi:MAG: hypothetical protein EOO61_19795 [Hymenobacter sp.]|nr:MAG: hypothetical protein EOO61_19795 [Hymenobacter sp.]
MSTLQATIQVVNNSGQELYISNQDSNYPDMGNNWQSPISNGDTATYTSNSNWTDLGGNASYGPASDGSNPTVSLTWYVPAVGSNSASSSTTDSSVLNVSNTNPDDEGDHVTITFTITN